MRSKTQNRIVTPYGHARARFEASAQFKALSNPATLGVGKGTARTFLENRLKEAFEAGWNARDAQPQPAEPK